MGYTAIFSSAFLATAIAVSSAAGLCASPRALRPGLQGETGGPTTPAFEGFEALPAAKIHAPSKLRPALLATAPATGLIALGDEKAVEGMRKLRAWTLDRQRQWRRHELASLPERFLPGRASPKRAALRLVRIPWLASPVSWTYALLGADRPRFLHPVHAFLPFPIGPRQIRAPVLGDLDRDGIPELWLLAAGGEIRKQGQALPTILDAPGSSEEEVEPRIGDWLKPLDRARQVLLWDLDADQYDDALVIDRTGTLRLFVGATDGELELAGEEAQPRGKENGELRCDRICLSPLTGDVQRLLAMRDGKSPLLLSRSAQQGVRFSVDSTASEDLKRLRVRDARFVDLELDGSYELLLLAQSIAEAKDGEAEKSPDPAAWRLLLYEVPKEASGRLRQKKRSRPLPHAIEILLGDLDGDAATDLILPRSKAAPLLFRNRALDARRSGSEQNWNGISLAILDKDGDSGLGIGSYIEVLVSEERRLKLRWPPLDLRDQAVLPLSFADADPEDLSVIVTWPDGNAQELDLQVGRFMRVSR